MSTTSTPPAPAGLKNDYADLVNLLAALTAATTELNSLEADASKEQLALAKGYIERYKELQTTIGETEAALQVIAARNPQWFAKATTLKTPFGAVKRTTATSLVIADETMTIALIRAAKREDDFLNVETTISIESLEKLEDAELAKLGVRRSQTHNFKPSAKKAEFGEAVGEAEKSPAAAKKTAKGVAAA
ncbi:MAG: host-nuclease inhibitor Gam family protein [Verrucomicrobia bacterium]|nr:host-nuclease inhibitor Gam family protein [Verrucomicrobiota bacterium]